MFIILTPERDQWVAFWHFMTAKLPDQPLGTILQRLRHVRRLDLVTPGQVGDCSGQFQDAVIGSRREIELAHRRADETVAGFI